MPLFEYRCTKCNTKFEVLHKSVNSTEEVICPQCSSTENKKLMSSFSPSVSSLSGFSAPACTECEHASQHGGGCASGMCGLN